MIMGTTLMYVFLVSIANLSVDFIYVIVDPRIRLTD
jgi:ABC-type dipeptide/oligopeptide/nickel transport system permease component